MNVFIQARAILCSTSERSPSGSAKCSLVDRLNELYCTMPLSISGLALLAQCTPIHTQFNVGYRYSGDPSLRTYKL